MTMPVHVVSCGARTPLGRCAAPSAAAVRASVNAAGLHPFFIDQAGDRMPAACDSEIEPTVVGPARFLALAEPALREACAWIDRAGGRELAMPLFLSLPEHRPGFADQDAAAISFGLQALHDLPVRLTDVRTATGGHAEGLVAMASALHQMERGAIEACLVGGIDSYFHPDTMEWLDDQRQLVGSVSRSAFVPGEAAGFCLLVSETAAFRSGLTGPRVRAAAIGSEAKTIKTPQTCLGEGLTQTVTDAVRGVRAPDEQIDKVICDINGERYRGEEWGFVSLRLAHYFVDPTSYTSPADCWGDVGAASGPLFVMLACQAAARGYAKGPLTLVWASSESGLRAATLLEATFQAVARD